MDWRKHEGYIITNSISIGDSEIVLGVHETRPNDFVTWECRNKNNYMYAYHTSSLLSAQKEFCIRGALKAELYERDIKKIIAEPER